MTHNARMEAAMAELDAQLQPNFSAVAKNWLLERTTLAKRWRGQTMSREEANSEYRQLLTNAQEEALIARINHLTDRCMPPTSRIVKNMAEEIRGGEVNKNWTAHFVKRHQGRLKSLYLRNIDNLRAQAEYEPMFQHFFDLVE